MYTGAIRKSRAFSLIELVIVVVIIGIIAAIAIPRMSRGASGANDGALQSNLAALRKAIDLYAAEHNNTFPAADKIADQLTKYTNELGVVTPDGTQTGGYIYGPYLRAIPVQTVGGKKGSAGIAAADAAGIGWLYNATTGVITANAGTDKDANGKAYSEY
jgi:general secretion pathway protein G